ncbi:MAG: TauD/TfdA family dioxygenase [Gammaproteobacteria bacterium]|nr:TauD/TfdA family dioxygenase [Gammaproteobacteria bacterium]
MSNVSSRCAVVNNSNSLLLNNHQHFLEPAYWRVLCLKQVFIMKSDQSPFLIENRELYQKWRDEKLANYPQSIADIIVEVADPKQLTEAEHEAMYDRLERTNMVIYVSPLKEADKDIPRRMAAQFGLERLNNNFMADNDGITELRINPEGQHPKYIPYTNRPINWHTDGYYNSEQIHGLLVHCVRSAAVGGESELVDHEMAYLLLRDRSEEQLAALMQPDAMTIPEGVDSEGGPRGKSIGPVFSINDDGSLHMRYTARKRNIEWKDDPVTQKAVASLIEILDADKPYIFKGRLEAGMGLVSRNVLHKRAGFDSAESSERLFYRARYFDAIPKREK